MRRGDIVLVSLDPAAPPEQGKVRPAVVVTNDGANLRATELGSGMVAVVPVTTNVSRVYSFQVLLPARETGLPRDGKAQAEQLRSVSASRVVRVVGRLPPERAVALDRAIEEHLGLK